MPLNTYHWVGFIFLETIWLLTPDSCSVEMIFDKDRSLHRYQYGFSAELKETTVASKAASMDKQQVRRGRAGGQGNHDGQVGMKKTHTQCGRDSTPGIQLQEKRASRKE